VRQPPLTASLYRLEVHGLLDLDEDGLNSSHLLHPHFIRAAQVLGCFQRIFHRHVEGKRHDFKLTMNGDLNLHIDDLPSRIVRLMRVVVVDS